MLKLEAGVYNLNSVLVTVDYEKLTPKIWSVWGLKKRGLSLFRLMNEVNRLANFEAQLYWEAFWCTFIQTICPLNYTLRESYRTNIKFYALTNFFKTYCLFFGRPTRGQRTWSNAKTPKKINTILREWLVELHCKQYLFQCPPIWQQRVTHMEFLNSLWRLQWFHEWKSAKYAHKRYLRYSRYKRWSFGVLYTEVNKGLSFYKCPYKEKRKKNKKKIKYPKNQFNIGFDKNFTIAYFRKIFNPVIWKKKRRFLI